MLMAADMQPIVVGAAKEKLITILTKTLCESFLASFLSIVIVENRKVFIYKLYKSGRNWGEKDGLFGFFTLNFVKNETDRQESRGNPKRSNRNRCHQDSWIPEGQKGCFRIQDIFKAQEGH